MNHYYIEPENYIELTAEIADYILQYSSLDPVTETDENGDERYTEEKQDEFLQILDDIKGMLAAAGIHKEPRILEDIVSVFED